MGDNEWPSMKNTEAPTKDKWPSMKETYEPTMDGWPTPQPTKKTDEPTKKEWTTPQPTKSVNSWPTEPPTDDKWPSEKKTESPTKDEWPTPQPTKKTDEPTKNDWPTPSPIKGSEDPIDLLSTPEPTDETASKWSAKTVDGKRDSKMTTTKKPDKEDKYKKALVVVWKPLDLVTFIQLIGILVVLLTFCFVARGMCFGPRGERKGRKIVSDYDSDDLTDIEDDLEKSKLER